MELLNENQIRVETLDHLGLVSATLKKIGLIDKLNQRLPVSQAKGSKISMGHRVAAMILNGLGFIDDRLYMFPKFLENKPVNRLLLEGAKAEDFNDDALGRCLDSIYDYGVTKLFTEVAFEIGIEQEVLGETAHFDTTSLTVYGNYNIGEVEVKKETEEQGAIKVTYGHSKDHRSDLKQMVLNLATTGASAFPVWMEAHNGNASDKKVLHEAAQKMKTFCAGIKEAPEFLYVGDSAMYENCVKYGGEMKWLSRVPERIIEAKKHLETSEEELKWETLENGYRITSLFSNYGGIKQRWVLVFSEQAYEREKKTLDRNVNKEEETLRKELSGLGKKEFKCEKDAEKAGIDLVKKGKYRYHEVVYTIEATQKHTKKGRPKNGEQPEIVGYHILGTLHRDEKKIELSRLRKGRFILATNQLDTKALLDTDILSEYKNQSKTEGGFKFIKGNAFEVASVYLKKPSRVEALMMIMTLCLMVYSLAQHQLRTALKEEKEMIPNQVKKPTATPTFAWICRIFHGIHILHIQTDSLEQELTANLKDLTKRIIKYFGQTAEEIYGLNNGS